MSAIKTYKHIIKTNVFGISKKIKEFRNANKNRKHKNRH